MAPKSEQLNRALKQQGFGGLDDPAIVQQFAFCVRDHEHFRSILLGVVPEQRTNAYEAMRPYLRFDPRPLDVYMAEAADLAARKEQDQIPLEVLATEAIRQNQHEKDGALTLVCDTCTVHGIFRAKLRKHAEKEAHSSGWRSTGEKSYCPKHVPTRCTMKLRCSTEDCLVEQKVRCWDPQDGYASARLRGWIIGDAAYCPRCSLKQTVLQ